MNEQQAIKFGKLMGDATVCNRYLETMVLKINKKLQNAARGTEEYRFLLEVKELIKRAQGRLEDHV